MSPSRRGPPAGGVTRSSRPTRRSTIHFCSVVGSRKRWVFPSSVVSSHDGPDASAASPGVGVGVALALRDTMNVWPHVVHCTEAPRSATLASSSSYSVWHRSQRTSIGDLPLRPYRPQKGAVNIPWRSRHDSATARVGAAFVTGFLGTARRAGPEAGCKAPAPSGSPGGRRESRGRTRAATRSAPPPRRGSPRPARAARPQRRRPAPPARRPIRRSPGR